MWSFAGLTVNKLYDALVDDHFVVPVTLWEAYTKGKEPYEHMSGWDATIYVEKGYRLAKPEACPIHIYEVLLECWLMDRTKRPTFKDLAKIFTRNSSIYENTNILAND